MNDSQIYSNGKIDLEKMLTLSEQIQTENEELKEQTSSLLSQISILKEELRKSNGREVKLNEKIAKMSESDKIEQENKRLKERNESLKREKMYAKQEAETRVSNFKAQYDADYRELKKQKERLANREKELDEKEAKINENVSNEVGYIRNQMVSASEEDKHAPVPDAMCCQWLCSCHPSDCKSHAGLSGLYRSSV